MTDGDILLFRFPQTDLLQGKLRPALVIKCINNSFDDVLVCMISTQTRHQVENLEMIISESTVGFDRSGLKQTSLIRTSRLAVVSSQIFEGKIGRLPEPIFNEVRSKLAKWISGA